MEPDIGHVRCVRCHGGQAIWPILPCSIYLCTWNLFWGRARQQSTVGASTQFETTFRTLGHFLKHLQMRLWSYDYGLA